MSDEDATFTIGQAAKAAGISRNTLKTLRMRGHTAMWDSGDDSEDREDRSWRRYTALDVALLSAQVDMMNDGVGADASASMLQATRGKLFKVEHPSVPSPDDIWIGVIRSDVEEHHCAGTLADVLAETKTRALSGVCRATLFVNISNHFRHVRTALEKNHDR